VPAHVVADLSEAALGCNRGRGFLHDGGLDLARLGDLLHRVRDRPGLTAGQITIESGITKVWPTSQGFSGSTGFCGGSAAFS
jgi:hypothetical protein